MSLSRRFDYETFDSTTFSRLRRGEWFGGLPLPVAKTLFEAGRCIPFDAGQMIYNEGAQSQGLFGLVDGAVHFEAVDRMGRRIPVHIASPGYWFGGIEVAAQAPMPVSARAFGPGRALQIAPSTMSRLLRESPELYRALASLAVVRLLAFVDLVAVMQRPTSIAQVAGRLALLGKISKASDQSVKRPVICATQADMADMTGHSRQTINAIISRLQKQRLIQAGRRQIEILDPDGLDNYWACGNDQLL
jgi:CRP/FNR family transcriptional regulator, cyclic AMP receptor protein